MRTWNDAFGITNQPTMKDIKRFIGEEFLLWDEMLNYIESEYKVKPTMNYSRCPMQPGWNIKYKKSGKALCTLYPMDGYFVALIVIGAKEENAVNEISESFTSYVNDLYNKTPIAMGSKWLMINVTDNGIFNDIKAMIKERVKNK